MTENKERAEQEGKTYYPKHKHFGTNITSENFEDLRSIIYPQE